VGGGRGPVNRSSGVRRSSTDPTCGSSRAETVVVVEGGLAEGGVARLLWNVSSWLEMYCIRDRL